MNANGPADPALVSNGGDEKPIVVTQSSAQRDGLFGLLTIVFCVALVRGVNGATTTAGAIAAATFCSAVVIGLVLLWRLVRRQGSRLLISTDRIALVSSTKNEPKVLNRAEGDQLHFVVRGASRFRYTALAGRGDAAPLTIQLFSRKKVRAACIARGWRVD